MKLILLILSICISYTLLRGWPDSWHSIVRVCLAVSALVIAFALWGRPTKPTTTLAHPARKPRLLDYLTVGIALLLIECFFLIFLSLAPSKTEKLAYDLDASLHPEIHLDRTPYDPNPNTPSSASNPQGNRVTSNWLFSGSGSRSLNKNDKVTPSNRPELYLFPASKSDTSRLLSTQLFLRHFTLATYRSGSWLPLPAIPKPLTVNNNIITIPTTKPGPSVTYDISHPASPYGQTLAVTIPDLTSIQLPALRLTSPDTYRLPTSAIDKNHYRYQATSTLFNFDQLEKNTLIPGIPPSPEYLALPTDPALRQKIQTLSSTLGPPTHDSLLKLRELLRTRYQYSLNVNMPDDADPLDSFLFKSRVGYCTHFATATAMLTRAMGIPSRIAFGWSGGRHFQEPNLFVFRAREAHAWTEIYLQNLGWVIFETTPANRDEGNSSSADQDETSPFSTLHDQDQDEESTSPLALAPLLKIATTLGLTSLLALFITLLLRRSTTPAAPLSPTLNLLPTSPHYLTAFRRACLAHGHPMPPGRTLRTHLSLINAPPFTHDLLDYHYNVHYGQAPSNKATEKKLLENLKAWEKSISNVDQALGRLR